MMLRHCALWAVAVALFAGGSQAAGANTYSGRVVLATSDAGLCGVVITLSGTSISQVTDSAGNYSLQGPELHGVSASEENYRFVGTRIVASPEWTITNFSATYTPPPPPVPPAPTDLRARKITRTKCDLIFRDPAATVNVGGYSVEEQGAQAWVSLGNLRPGQFIAHIIHLKPKSTHVFRVRTFNSSGFSEPSNVLTLKTKR